MIDLDAMGADAPVKNPSLESKLPAITFEDAMSRLRHSFSRGGNVQSMLDFAFVGGRYETRLYNRLMVQCATEGMR